MIFKELINKVAEDIFNSEFFSKKDKEYLENYIENNIMDLMSKEDSFINFESLKYIYEELEKKGMPLIHKLYSFNLYLSSKRLSVLNGIIKALGASRVLDTSCTNGLTLFRINKEIPLSTSISIVKNKLYCELGDRINKQSSIHWIDINESESIFLTKNHFDIILDYSIDFDLISLSEEDIYDFKCEARGMGLKFIQLLDKDGHFIIIHDYRLDKSNIEAFKSKGLFLIACFFYEGNSESFTVCIFRKEKNKDVFFAQINDENIDLAIVNFLIQQSSNDIYEGHWININEFISFEHLTNRLNLDRLSNKLKEQTLGDFIVHTNLCINKMDKSNNCIFIPIVLNLYESLGCQGSIDIKDLDLKNIKIADLEFQSVRDYGAYTENISSDDSLYDLIRMNSQIKSEKEKIAEDIIKKNFYQVVLNENEILTKDLLSYLNSEVGYRALKNMYLSSRSGYEIFKEDILSCDIYIDC